MEVSKLNKNDDDCYICDGYLRIFSNINVTTYDCILASQNDINILEQLNEYMLNPTKKESKTK